MCDTNPKTLKGNMGNIINQDFGIEVLTKSVIKLGKRTCLMEFNNSGEKRKVVENRKTLKHVEDGRIYINNDLTEAERKIQKCVKTRVEEERKERSIVNIGLQRLTINGIEWKWSKQKEDLEPFIC